MKSTINSLKSLVLAAFIGCNMQSHELEKSLFEIAKAITKTENFEKNVILFIPIKGCGSCVDTALWLIEQNINDPGIKYIFAGDGFRKSTISTASWIDEIKCDQCFIDYKGTSSAYGLVQLMPTAYLIKNNRLQKAINITSNSDGINEITGFIKE